MHANSFEKVWDKDTIGKDEFMGMAFVPWSALHSSAEDRYSNDYIEVDLKSRPGKKDKVSESLKVGYIFRSGSDRAQERAKQEALLQKQEAEKAEEERRKKEEKEQAEDEAAAKIAEEHAGKLDLDLVKKFVGAAVKCGIDPNKPITDPIKLFDVLIKAELYHQAASSSYFGMDLSARTKAHFSSPDFLKLERERLFNLFDVSGDGKIDFQELLFGLAQIAEGSAEQKAEFFFDSFDKDKSGTLDEKEIKAVLKLLVQRILQSVYAFVMDQLKMKTKEAITERETLSCKLAQVAAKEVRDKVDVDSMAETFTSLVRSRFFPLRATLWADALYFRRMQFVAKEGKQMTKAEFVAKSSAAEFEEQMNDLSETIREKILARMQKDKDIIVEDYKRRFITIKQMKTFIDEKLPTSKYDFVSALYD
jgi:hypothetical protein